MKKRFYYKVNRLTVYGAAATDNVDVLNQWVDYEDIDILAQKDEYGRTPLHYAVANGAENVVRAILGHPIIRQTLDEQDIPYKRTALHYAALSGSDSIVQILEDAGADRNKLDKMNKKYADYSERSEIAREFRRVMDAQKPARNAQADIHDRVGM